MAKPIIHHRTPAFEKALSSVIQKLKTVFQTQNEVLVQASVGSGGMEAAVTNCFAIKDKVIVVKAGKFGERWSDQAKKFGLDVVDYEVPWGQALDLAKIKELIKTHKPKGLLTQACETSTGVFHPIKDLGELVKKEAPDTLLLIDAITALGITDIRTDEWGLDVVVTGSQKAFMLPPGLTMVSLSPKALKACEKSNIPKYYFNFIEELKAQKKNQTYFTPAISLIQGLSIALDMMLEEGLPNLFKRHQRLALATREAIMAMGLELFSRAPSDSITAVVSPAKIDGEEVVKKMQSKYNFTIIGGQDQLKGRVFRLGHMGYCGDFDVIGVIAALEMSLKDLGFKLEVGKGVQKAVQVLHEKL